MMGAACLPRPAHRHARRPCPSKRRRRAPSKKSSRPSARTRWPPPAKRLGFSRGIVPTAARLWTAARRLIFAKGNDSHDYKYSSAVLEDYLSRHSGLARPLPGRQHVPAAWLRCRRHGFVSAHARSGAEYLTARIRLASARPRSEREASCGAQKKPTRFTSWALSSPTRSASEPITWHGSAWITDRLVNRHLPVRHAGCPRFVLEVVPGDSRDSAWFARRGAGLGGEGIAWPSRIHGPRRTVPSWSCRQGKYVYHGARFCRYGRQSTCLVANHAVAGIHSRGGGMSQISPAWAGWGISHARPNTPNRQAAFQRCAMDCIRLLKPRQKYLHSIAHDRHFGPTEMIANWR